MKTPLDPHGQPLNRLFSARRISERSVDELIGLCRGIVADRDVNDLEAAGLLRWIEANREAAARWPGNMIYSRLREMMVDHRLDADERRELLRLISDLTGSNTPVGQVAANFSTALPLTKPPPEVIFPERLFCLTGRFAFGSREDCESAVVSLGATSQAAPTRKTHYVVIGAMGSTDWIHSSYGRKIERAVELRGEGRPIAILGEQHWTSALNNEIKK